MTPLNVSLEGYRISVFPSEIHVSTGKAFSVMQPRHAPFDLRELPEIPVSEWKNVIGNDFEEPVFAMHPELAEKKKALYEQGAVYVQMSGSGSALFGIFEHA